MLIVGQEQQNGSKKEDVMRATINTLIALLATTPAYAANGATDEPGLLVWAFMGFCAVILVGQLVPAAMLVIGAIKGLATHKEEAKDH
jgi:hypothetical protein